MQTRIYKLVPIARADDQNWDRATDQGVVTVRAVSSGDARIVATYAEAAALTLKANIEATTQVNASAFRDSKLYTVVEDDSGEFPAEGPRQALRAVFQIPEGYNTPGPPSASET